MKSTCRDQARKSKKNFLMMVMMASSSPSSSPSPPPSSPKKIQKFFFQEMKSACRDQARKSKNFVDDVGMIIVLFDWKCVLGASLSCLVFLVEFFSFSLCPNFGLRAPIWLFNTIFGICRPRATILEHKKNLFKHYKRLKSGRARLADLKRVQYWTHFWANIGSCSSLLISVIF